MTTKYEQLAENISDYSTAWSEYWSDLETVISRLESEVVNNLGIPNNNRLVFDGKDLGKFVNVGVKGKIPQISAIDSVGPKEMKKNIDDMSITFAISVAIIVQGQNSPVGNYFDLKVSIINNQFVFTIVPVNSEEFTIYIERGVAATISLERFSTAIFDYINERYDSKKLK
ncbi:hypothetical protein V2E82_000671 [Klebsiella aerogenes]|nr:hypothetical protein [Klebsiella aerogenes]EMF0743340.1 hypothetical protein [Klebsiella aerogenes]